jgi:hypothetical protein
VNASHAVDGCDKTSIIQISAAKVVASVRNCQIPPRAWKAGFQYHNLYHFTMPYHLHFCSVSLQSPDCVDLFLVPQEGFEPPAHALRMPLPRLDAALWVGVSAIFASLRGTLTERHPPIHPPISDPRSCPVHAQASPNEAHTSRPKSQKQPLTPDIVWCCRCGLNTRPLPYQGCLGFAIW